MFDEKWFFRSEKMDRFFGETALVFRQSPPVTIAEQNIFASRTHGKYQHTLKSPVKSFFITQKITAFSPEHVGIEIRADMQTANSLLFLLYDKRLHIAIHSAACDLSVAHILLHIHDKQHDTSAVDGNFKMAQ